MDLIIQSIHDGNTNDIAFTVDHASINQAEAVSNAFGPMLQQQRGDSLDQTEVIVDRDIAKISIVGAGMIGRPGIAAQMFRTLADANINLQMISTSEVNVSCTIAKGDCDRAIKELCAQFEVESSLADSEIDPNWPAVRGVALDLKQARLAIRNVTDRPGMAAHIFQKLAAANISVDMIIQSQRSRSVHGVMTRDIAFTVPQIDLAMAQTLLAEISKEMGGAEITADSEIAKVSIVGMGMLGRPGVGKTTALREIARVLADELGKRVVIIDTSNEIAGDGDIPHSAIGKARRMQVARPELQHQVMIEAVENHMPEVIVIDEIGTELEAIAARTIAERGVQLVGTAHGNRLENLLKNPI